jgi:hypothetical protein
MNIFTPFDQLRQLKGSERQSQSDHAEVLGSDEWPS